MLHFDNTFVFQSLLKDEAALKIPFFSVSVLTIPFPFLFPYEVEEFKERRPEPGLTTPFPAKMFPNRLAPKVPNKILKNPPFCSFVSFLIFLVTPFNKILESSRAWIIFVMPFIYLFEIIKVTVPEPWIFFWISASITEGAAVIPNGAKTFYAKGIATLINGPANLLNNDPKNPPDWILLEIWALESAKSVDTLLLNAFLSFVFLSCCQ